jgi:hypothetical protein
MDKRQFPLYGSGSETQTLPNVFRLEIGKVRENLWLGESPGQQSKYCSHRDPHIIVPPS